MDSLVRDVWAFVSLCEAAGIAIATHELRLFPSGEWARWTRATGRIETWRDALERSS